MNYSPVSKAGKPSKNGGNIVSGWCEAIHKNYCTLDSKLLRSVHFMQRVAPWLHLLNTFSFFGDLNEYFEANIRQYEKILKVLSNGTGGGV